MNGMLDYAVENDTAVTYRARNVEDVARKIKYIIKKPSLIEELIYKINNRLKLMGTREDNMRKMVMYLENPKSWRE
jgi:hypothetical protein